MRVTWRWLFCEYDVNICIRAPFIDRYTDLNLPISGVALFLVVFFLRVKAPEGSLKDKIAKIDWL